MQNKKRIYFLTCIGIVLLIMSGMYFHKQNITKYIEYKTFLSYVEKEQVDTAKIGSSEKIQFTLKGQKQLYTTDNPRIENFKEQLLLHDIKVEERSTSNTNGAASILNMGLFIGIIYIVYQKTKRVGSGQGAMAFSTKPVEANELPYDFTKIAGNVEAKEQVQDVIDFIKDPDKYRKMGARMPKGLIFYGPPGTGKTLMAKAIAKEAGVAFFAVNGSDFVQMYVGVGASRIRQVFEEARKHKKAVIFIDEIDAIGKKRGGQGANQNDEKDQTLNALLTQMSGFLEDESIVVIAATNRLDILDEALLRPGRFDRQIEIGYPDKASREQILKFYLKNKPVSEEIEVKELVNQTPYFTGAMIENLLNEAAILAAKDNDEVIGKEHINSAFYTIIAGKEKKDKSGITALDRRITAFHEAGHALVTKLLAPEHCIAKVTIIPSTKGAGGFSMNIPKDKMYMTKKEIRSQIQISLAGRVAEELVFGKESITTGASNDIQKANQYLKSYMTEYGMDEEIGLLHLETFQNAGMQQLVMNRCTEEMKKLYQETKWLIQENDKKLSQLAETLLEKETLDEQEIASLLE